MPRLPLPTEAEIAISVFCAAGAVARCGKYWAKWKSGTGLHHRPQAYADHDRKRLLVRDEAARSHVYRAAIPETRTLRGLAGHLLDRAFGGSAKKLLVAALSARPASAADLAEMRRLIRRGAPAKGNHHEFLPTVRCNAHHPTPAGLCLHSLWQGGPIALVLAATLLLTRSPRLRL